MQMNIRSKSQLLNDLFLSIPGVALPPKYIQIFATEKHHAKAILKDIKEIALKTFDVRIGEINHPTALELVLSGRTSLYFEAKEIFEDVRGNCYKGNRPTLQIIDDLALSLKGKVKQEKFNQWNTDTKATLSPQGARLEVTDFLTLRKGI